LKESFATTLFAFNKYVSLLKESVIIKFSILILGVGKIEYFILPFISHSTFLLPHITLSILSFS
jgi:hypothetical protein